LKFLTFAYMLEQVKMRARMPVPALMRARMPVPTLMRARMPVRPPVRLPVPAQMFAKSNGAQTLPWQS
jgi:hypothetical protein